MAEVATERLPSSTTSAAAAPHPPPAPSHNTPMLDRQTLLDTAVRFLQNPKVVPTPIESKKLFLSKKGLSESEIEKALKMAGCIDSSGKEIAVVSGSALTPPPSLPPQQCYTQQLQQPPAKPSIWLVVFRVLRGFIFAGCIAYTTYKLLIKKYLLGQKSQKQASLDKMKTANEQLNQTVKEMKASISSLKETVESMNETIKQLNVQKPSSSLNTDATSELKGEIQSLRNLLLNRSQFPSIPNVAPLLPSWQLNAKKEAKINGDNKEDEQQKEEEDTVEVDEGENDSS